MRTAALALFGAIGLAAASDVLDLTQDTFGSTISSEPLALVEFFAPWCGHCKALAPQYEEAATALKPSNIPLAKVDCTAEADLCSSHGVSGYPTLKIFRNGVPTDYGGSRKADGIISYMKKQSLPAVSTVTAANHAEFTASDRIVVVGYVEEGDVPNRQTFDAFAESHRDDYLFGLATEPSAFAAAKVQPPSVVLYKTFDEGRNELAGSFTPDGLVDFVAEHSIPLLDEITPENFATYAEAGIPLAYIFIESADAGRPALTKSLEPVARAHKGKINFVWIDATKFADHAKSLNLQESKWPAFAIQNVQEMLKFPLDQSKSVDAKTVGSFVDDFVAGKIAPSVKSEPVPKSQSGPVYVLVADEFDKVVSDSKKDLLVEFYAPWCGHCKKLAPTWDTLGERYAGSKDKVMIAKMDATANDVPPSAGFKITGFPSIRLRPAGKTEWIEYSADRSLESFEEFLAVNGSNGAKPSVNTGSEQVVMGGSGSDANVRDEL